MNTSFQFTVIGEPQPQGSTRAFIPKGWNRAVITTANKKNKPWRQECSNAAMVAIETFGFVPMMNGEPVELSVDFYFDKPKSVKKSVACKVTKPDVDKLVRSVCDALTGIAFKDDAQIVRLHSTKRFGTPSRAVVTVCTADFSENYPEEGKECKAIGLFGQM